MLVLVPTLLAALAALPAIAQTPAPAEAPPRAIKPTLDCHSDTGTEADFNGDGTDDVALAAPFDDLFRNEDVGSLNVVYGDAGDEGLDSTTDQFFSPASPGFPAFKWVFGPGRLFGKGLAAGDFNNDGYTDLAAGAPGAPVEDTKERASVATGAVFVLYGTAEGLSTRFSQAIHQNSSGVPGTNEAGDSFGWTLAAGDFNGDGADDLAVGGPGEDIDRTRDAGAVWVIYGRTGSRASGGGLTSNASVAPQILIQGRGSLLDLAEPADMFGLALTSGNFNGDSIGGNPIDDLAVGVPQEDIGIRADTGAVQVVHGASAGLTADDQFWHQSSPGVQGANETGDLYGCALAAGNFTGLRFGSAPRLVDVEALAIGVPGEDVVQRDQGGVNVIYPSPGGQGLTAAAGPGEPDSPDVGDQFFIEHPGLAGLNQPAQVGARFGQSLNAQNIDPVRGPSRSPQLDPAWELVIGVPGADGGAGEIFVIGGIQGDGLRDLESNSYVLDQDALWAHRGAESGDGFGRALAFGDHDDDGDLDLVVGAPGDSSCGELHETGELISIGPAVPIGGDEEDRAGAALSLYGDGSQIGTFNGPVPHLTPPGLGNWSLTRCDYVLDETDFYGLSGDAQANAEFSHTIAGL